MGLEADGSISIYDLETSNVIATLEGLEVYYAIKTAIDVFDFLLDYKNGYIKDHLQNQKIVIAFEKLKYVLNERNDE